MSISHVCSKYLPEKVLSSILVSVSIPEALSLPLTISAKFFKSSALLIRYGVFSSPVPPENNCVVLSSSARATPNGSTHPMTIIMVIPSNNFFLFISRPLSSIDNSLILTNCIYYTICNIFPQ